MGLKRWCVCLLFCAATVWSAVPPAPDWLPAGAVAVVQVVRPEAVLGLASALHVPLDSPEVKGFVKLVPGAGDPLAVVRQLAGGGVTWAVYPKDQSIFVIDAGDASVFSTVQQALSAVAKAQAGKPGVFFREYPGVTALSLDGKNYFAFAGARALMSTSPELIKSVFEREGKGVASLGEAAFWKRAVQEAGPSAAVIAALDMAALNRLPATAKSFASSTPIDILLTGAMKESMRGARWFAAGLTVDGRSLRLHAATDGKAGASAVFSIPASGGALPTLQVPRELASVTLWRDLRGFYAARDTLYPERTSGGILLENFLEIFFTGRDLTEEVFARFHPEVRLVVARQEWDPKIGSPREQYPAAALVFRADRAEDFGEVLEEAWQKAIGITNFTRGQQAQPGLIIDKGAHAGVAYTVAYYSARSEKDRANLPARFNVRPTLARVGPYMILSSTDQLARDLIDAVNKEDGRWPAPTAREHTVVEIASGAGIAGVLETNRGEFIRQNLMKSGARQAAVEAEFDRNLTLLRLLESARLSLRATDAGGQAADLEVRLR
jgi:hypothetical protein